ncbi:NUDIX domain-containing protein [Lysinibacillus capsici]|uniref:NUDIX domain-containing protein n=1 Tax=Lysinibacillus capsici TaxID=2115968 RepID=UPI0028EA50F2|nr:NUDIX domain-containing protein [Lysinibacillus capsici]MED4554797.1 NUDIX domain-containing protein [Lysinibacillus capsici]
MHIWIRNNKGEFLLTKRHPNKHYPHLWECPGGSIVTGESSLDGAIREVEEEIGISLLRTNGQLVKSERRDCFNIFMTFGYLSKALKLVTPNFRRRK